jgi:ActR/RegA family two-component response regulator
VSGHKEMSVSAERYDWEAIVNGLNQYLRNHGPKARSLGEHQSGLPVRRGLRRKAATSLRSSVSGSESRCRN